MRSEDELEDLQALGSPTYLRSIEEAREDVRAGRVTPLDDLLSHPAVANSSATASGRETETRNREG
jgi:hypothetical protein